MTEESKQQTEYVVLRQQDGGWKEEGTTKATSPERAIKAATMQEDGSNKAGDFKAVPLRSWKLTISIKTEQKTISHFQRVEEDTAPSDRKTEPKSPPPADG